MSTATDGAMDVCKRISSKRRRQMIAVSAVCTVAVGGAFGGYLYYGAVYAPGWHTSDDGTYYIEKESKERATGMQLINNSTYLFDDNGYILTGWQEYDGEKYYLDKSGVLQKGRVEIDGQEYYFADDSGIFRRSDHYADGQG